MTEIEVIELLTWLRGLCPLMTEQQEEFIQHELLPMELATARAGVDRYVRRPNPNPAFEAYDKLRLSDLLADFRHERERRAPSRVFGGGSPIPREQVHAAIEAGARASADAAEFLTRHRVRTAARARVALSAEAMRAIEKSSRALEERQIELDNVELRSVTLPNGTIATVGISISGNDSGSAERGQFSRKEAAFTHDSDAPRSAG